MQEDIKLIVTADTTTAEKQIDKLDEKEIKIKTDIKVPKNSLKEVKEEADILGKRVADIKLNKKAFSKDDIKILKAEIEATALKAKSIYFGDGSKSAKELSDRLKDMHKALGEGKKQAKETNQIFGSMDIMIGSLKAKIVASIVNTLKQGVVEGSKLAGQLEYAVEKTRTISTSNRGIISDEVERIGKKYGTDYREVSEGLYQVVSAIGDVHKKYALLETSNKLAITGFSSVNESVDGLTTVLNAYNLEIEEAERVANVFVRTQKVGKLTVQEFQQQLYKTVPTAKELGIQVDEIGASIALLTAKGSKAEVAQTQMGAFMYELLDVGSDISKLFNQIAGQSINSFMNNGGSLEGILRTLKGYSNTNNFSIESLLGRKEAKSFWLNIGNDIDGYIEKLKAINAPMNELDRNVDNLMGTMEKRIERGARYWDSFKKSIGEVTLEAIASIGDMATGHDKETVARKKLNAEMEDSLRTLGEMAKKQSLSEEEQKKLNEALKVLEILAPEVAQAYKKWSIEGGNYADVLSLIKQRQDEVNKSARELSYTETKKDVEDTKKQIEKLNRELVYRTGSRKEGDFKEINWDKMSPEQRENLKRTDIDIYEKLASKQVERDTRKGELLEKEKNLKEKGNELDVAAGIVKKTPKPKNILERERELKEELDRFKTSYYKQSEDMIVTNDIKNNEEYRKLDEKLQNIEKEKQSEKERLEKRIKQLKGVKGSTPEIQKSIENEIVQLEKEKLSYGTSGVKGNNTDFTKIKNDINSKSKNEIAVLNEQYKKNIEKISNLPLETRKKEYEKINNEYEKKLGKIQDGRDIKLKENEIEQLKASVNNSTLEESKPILEKIELLENEINNISTNRKKLDFETDIKKQEDNERDRKKADEKAKNEIEKRNKSEQLKIDTEYNKKMLEATTKYNKDMAELRESGTKEEIEAVKKAYEESKRDIEVEKKVKTLENKKENTFYSTPEEKKINTEAITSEIDLTMANKEKEIADEKAKEAQEKNTKALENMSNNIKNLANMFQVIGDNSGSQTMKNLSNIGSIGSTIFDALKGTEQGSSLLTKVFGSGAIPGFKNFSMGAGVGSAISGALGGGAEGNIGSMIGSGIGAIAGGGPVGSIVGGAIGSIGGSLFGSKSKKKKRREEKRRKAAQERLQKGLISGQYKWADVVEAYNEDLAKLGTGSYIDLYDKVSANTSYDNVLSSLEGAKVGKDGVSMSTLKQLMPQYNEQELIGWFKSLTGGAVLNGDTLSTGEGKYGAIDITTLAQQVTNANRELEKSLKETIKNIIDFSADSLASVVKNGFFDGLDDLGDNLEKMLANSLKNAFINTEISKALFNGMSDKVSEMVKDMFKQDANLGIDLETGDLESLTLTQYMELIKKYMEASNEKLEDLFKELGMNMDNLTNSMDTLNKNMSKNTVQGMATNLWKHNTGQKVVTEFNGTFEVPVILNGQVLDKHIIKVTDASIRKSRRNKF